MTNNCLKQIAESIIILRVCTVSRACQHTWRSLMMCVREASGIFQPWAMEIAQSMLLLEILSMEVSGAENHASYSVVLSVRRLRRSKHLPRLPTSLVRLLRFATDYPLGTEPESSRRSTML